MPYSAKSSLLEPEFVCMSRDVGCVAIVRWLALFSIIQFIVRVRMMHYILVDLFVFFYL
jgi:hypothetical protein